MGLGPTTAEALDAIYEYAAGYDCFRNNAALESAPSDVLDGWATAEEVRPLVRRGLMYVIPLPRDECGPVARVTWHFTNSGMKLMRDRHANRVIELPPEDTKPRCPCCGADLSS